MNKKGLKLDIIQNNDRLCHQVQRKKINHPPTDLLFQSFVQVFCKDFILEISYFNIDSICCAEISIDSKRIVLVLKPNTSIKVDTSLAGRELKFSKNKGFIQCIFWRPLAVGNDLIPDDSLPAFAIIRVYYKCGDGSKRLTMTSEFDEMGYLDDGTKRVV